MFSSTRRVAAGSARQLARRQPIRNGSSSHGAHDAHHDAHHHHGPVNESFGKVFYIGIASIPVGAAIYSYSKSDGKTPALTRLFDGWSYANEQWVQRNALHTAALEQAAFDRHLFTSERDSDVIVELKFNEMFNVGSPYNVGTGAFINLDKVAAHYEKRNEVLEAERVEKYKSDKS